jgi:hypothetical protein
LGIDSALQPSRAQKRDSMPVVFALRQRPPQPRPGALATTVPGGAGHRPATTNARRPRRGQRLHQQVRRWAPHLVVQPRVSPGPLGGRFGCGRFLVPPVSLARLLSRFFSAHRFFGLVRGGSRLSPGGPRKPPKPRGITLGGLPGPPGPPEPGSKNLKTHTSCWAQLGGPARFPMP